MENQRDSQNTRDFNKQQLTMDDTDDVYIDMTSFALIGVSFKMADHSFLSFYFIKNHINLSIYVNKKMLFTIFKT